MISNFLPWFWMGHPSQQDGTYALSPFAKAIGLTMGQFASNTHPKGALSRTVSIAPHCIVTVNVCYIAMSLKSSTCFPPSVGGPAMNSTGCFWSMAGARFNEVPAHCSHWNLGRKRLQWGRRLANLYGLNRGKPEIRLRLVVGAHDGHSYDHSAQRQLAAVRELREPALYRQAALNKAAIQPAMS